ncbi:hypothetical protein Q5P01_008578 [Channa striata]|uniref:Uncharacterized protein n=1 Tax=Channa striata TaxID=64152 RepID=A0AA88N2U0_CHASR|nr:hypothetical protein Q5P01_008578 [Channa striata]
MSLRPLEMTSAPRDNPSPAPQPHPSAATVGIVRGNAPVGPAKPCRREETSCQKLPSYSLEILSPEATKSRGHACFCVFQRCKFSRLMPRWMTLKGRERVISKNLWRGCVCSGERLLRKLLLLSGKHQLIISVRREFVSVCPVQVSGPSRPCSACLLSGCWGQSGRSSNEALWDEMD